MGSPFFSFCKGNDCRRKTVYINYCFCYLYYIFAPFRRSLPACAAAAGRLPRRNMPQTARKEAAFHSVKGGLL